MRRQSRLEALDKGIRYRFVRPPRKEQRDIDVDAFADQLSDRGQAGRCGRDLDHDVSPIDRLPEASRLVQRRRRLIGEIR